MAQSSSVKFALPLPLSPAIHRAAILALNHGDEKKKANKNDCAWNALTLGDGGGCGVWGVQATLGR